MKTSTIVWVSAAGAALIVLPGFNLVGVGLLALGVGAATQKAAGPK